LHSNSSLSIYKTQVKSKIQPKSSNKLSSTKNIYSPHNYSTKINKKFIPIELKEDGNEQHTPIEMTNKKESNEYRSINNFKDDDNIDIYKQDSVKTIENNEEKISNEIVNESGYEEDTLKVNENFETNSNEEVLGHMDEEILSEKLSIISSTVNNSPDKKYDISTPQSLKLNINEFSINTKNNYYSPESPEFIKPISPIEYPSLNRISIAGSIISEHSILKSPVNKSEVPVSVNYQAQSLNLHQQAESSTGTNEENDINDKNSIEPKVRMHSSSFSGVKGSTLQRTLKPTQSLLFDKVNHQSTLKSKNGRSISFGSQKSLDFVDQESLKGIYEQEKDLMNNTSEEMRYSLDKFQSLIDRLTRQNSGANDDKNIDDKESKQIIAELTHELIKNKEESKELKERLNNTESKMNTLIDEKQSLEKLIENIKSKKNSIQQDYQYNMDQLHGDIADKTKKVR
jgi:hypothetical protein